MPAPRSPEFRRRAVELARLREKPIKRTAFASDRVGGPTARADGPAASPADLAVSTFLTGDAALPTEMTDPATGAGKTTWAYNTLGQTTREVLASGQTQTYAYGSDDTLTSTKISTSPAAADAAEQPGGTADLASYEYRYDELGRVLSRRTTERAPPARPSAARPPR
jgi:YD repeat-containing protein